MGPTFSQQGRVKPRGERQKFARLVSRLSNEDEGHQIILDRNIYLIEKPLGFKRESSGKLCIRLPEGLFLPLKEAFGEKSRHKDELV